MTYYSRYLLILFLFSSKLFAQNCTIGGYVSLSDDNQKEGIMIQLLDTTATKLFQFRTTDSTGYFKFDNIKKGFYKLHITQFGYNSTQTMVQCNQTNIDLKSIELTPLSINLKEISVIDKVYTMKKSGDTTIFNLKAFESGSEQSVSDIMMKIPGFTVNGTQYFFQNKPIKKVLIDGKDIADGNHTEFTDAIHYESVEDLRIIERYSDSFQPYKDKQDNELALDIKIKAKYSNKYQGTLYANGGYKNIYDAATTLIKTNSKTAFRIAATSSNRGINTKEMDINNVIKEVENNSLFKGYHHLLSQMNTHQDVNAEISNYFNQNNTYIKAAVDTKFAEKYSVKSNLLIQKRTENQDVFSVRQFFSGTVSNQDFLQLTTNDIWNALLNNNLSIAFTPSTNLQIDIPLSFITKIKNISEDVMFLGTSYKNESNNNIKQLSIAPIYKFHKTFSNGVTLSAFGMNTFTKDTDNLYISSKDSIARNFVFDPTKSIFLTDQTSNYSSSYFNNQIRLRKKIQNIDIQYNISLETNNENLSNLSLYNFDHPFIGSEKLEFTNFTNSFRSMYDKNLFRVVLGIIHTHSNIKATWGNAENIFLRPNILLMYRINSKWNVSSSYSTKLYQPSVIQVNNLQTLNSQLSVWEGGAEIQDVGVTETYNFSLFRSFEIGEEITFFNMMFSFIPKTSEIIPVYDFDSFFQVKSYELLEKDNQSRFQLFYSEKFRFWNYSINLMGSNSQLLMEDNFIKDKTFTSSFLVNYLKLKNIRISSGIDIRLSKRESSVSQTLNTYLRPRASIGWDKGMLQGRIWYQLMYNKINESENLYHALSFELSRKKVIKNFELNIKVYDVLNIIPANNYFTTFNPVYIQTDSFKSFRGQVLLGLKWYFKHNDS